MPELPEAETIVRGLRPHLEGTRILDSELLHHDVIAGDVDRFALRLGGRVVQEVERRGKNIVLLLDDGTRLVVNLGMSGRLLYRSRNATSPPPTHPAVRWSLSAGGALVYHDVRRFGRLELLTSTEYRAWSAGLGPEPLERTFTERGLAEGLARSISPVRQWLLDQRRVAGIGNIYANEALHRAGIHPATPAARVPRPCVSRLHRSIRRVLREAIEARGTTLRDYRTAGGDEGGYSNRLRVYGREGEPCIRCGGRIERVVFGNRSAFLCLQCQPPIAASTSDVENDLAP